MSPEFLAKVDEKMKMTLYDFIVHICNFNNKMHNSIYFTLFTTSQSTTTTLFTDLKTNFDPPRYGIAKEEQHHERRDDPNLKISALIDTISHGVTISNDPRTLKKTNSKQI